MGEAHSVGSNQDNAGANIGRYQIANCVAQGMEGSSTIPAGRLGACGLHIKPHMKGLPLSLLCVSLTVVCGVIRSSLVTSRLSEENRDCVHVIAGFTQLKTESSCSYR